MTSESKSEMKKFGGVAKTLHWFTAFIIILTLLLSYGLIGPGWDGQKGEEKYLALTLHSGNGILVLLLTSFRLWWRRVRGVPPYPVGMPAWQQWASRMTIKALYALLFYQPLVGIAQAIFYTEMNVVPFKLFNLTALAPSDERAAQVFHTLHAIGGIALGSLVLLHILAAFKHLLLDRDGVFQRMLPFGRV
tara:strand:- start:138 stop:710 length:573 start_codon:yes stop_codon:yes gene_type:complete